jgi:hypothetical protein
VRFPENRKNNREFLKSGFRIMGFGGVICKFIMPIPHLIISRPD